MIRLALLARILAVGLSTAVFAGAAMAQTPSPVPADTRTPLLMPGTTSLWQRVLTRPGAKAAPEPGGSSAGPEIPALSVLFVYGRMKSGDADWIEVGTTPAGRTLGWIPAAEAIDWKQTMVVLFTNPVNRDRALFFKDADPLLTLMESPDAGGRAATLRQAAESRALPADSPVTAIEPPTWIDPAKNFYLLPILNWTDGYFASGFSGLALEVAATSLQEKPDQPGPAKPDPETAARLLEGYRAGVVFVVDTTISMQPYVERTRATIEALTAKLAASEEGDRLSFGLIGYRDVMPDGTPDGYITKVFATLADGHDRASFLGRLDAAAASTANNLDFREDSLAGLKSALDEIDWTGVAGRFVVLVTDASPRRASDPYSATHLDPDQLRLLAQSKGAALMVIHLKTPAGKADHQAAEDAYTPMTAYPNIGSLYFPVEGGDVRTFGMVIDRISETILRQMDTGAKAEDANGAISAAASSPNQAAEATESTFARAGLVGRAMQLAYLGRMEGNQPPRLFSAWVSDRDIANPARKTLDVRVLITRNQLSDLQATLKAIIDAGESTRMAPNDFFRQLRSAAATMARRPEGVGSENARRLADLGLIGEYLEGLPYRSRIMELSEDDWLSWSFGQQRQFLDDLEAKVSLYRQIYDNTDQWIALDGDRSGGDAVSPIPLDALP
ncbi:vWA domain-containing protein [Inquilinus sp. Marseille-Q2685]|uniref:vWA domain-containing protein n=1 Tax=Inquilinus sp. Marseille-Q2685 TaxID=2866581 RepID=UPI001CE3EFDD|nr:vWA domain-containing protein [Inquilinus sp. Marseille-Q2685]